MEDTNPFNTTMRVYRGDNTYYRKSNQTVFGRFVNLTIDLNFSDDGNYTIEINASDKHTSNLFPDLVLKYDNDGNLTFYKKDNPQKNITLTFAYRVGSGNIQHITPSLITNYNITEIEQNESDRINFGFEADTPATEQNIQFGFKLNKQPYLKLVDENDNVLFHIHNNYWLDFKTYIVNVASGSKTLLSPIFIDKPNFYAVAYNIVFADYELSVGDRFQIITESIGGLNLVDITLNLVMDTTTPTFISAYNRTADVGNTTNILTNTNVNISIFGLDDLYLDRGNFSHNASGTWSNHSINIIGNQTPYHYVIGKGNFTANQVVGWKFYVFDKANNLLDSIYTFLVEEVIISTSPIGSGGGSVSLSTSTIEKIKEITEQYFINSSCSIVVIPKSVVLNNDNDKEVVQIRYLNLEYVNFSSKFVNVGNLKSAVLYLNKLQSSQQLYEKMNITISFNKDYDLNENLFAGLLLNFSICGSYVVPITVEANELVGKGFTLDRIFFYIKKCTDHFIKVLFVSLRR